MTPAELADYLDGLVRHDIKLSTMICDLVSIEA